MSDIAKHRQSEEAAWNLLDAERQATERLREQVAAQAAVIEKLREALPDTLWFLDRYSNRWDGINGKHPNCVVETAREALAIPTDSTQILDEVRRAERERCAKVCEEYDDRIEAMRDADYQADLAGRQAGAMRCAAAIRAME